MVVVSAKTFIIYLVTVSLTKNITILIEIVFLAIKLIIHSCDDKCSRSIKTFENKGLLAIKKFLPKLVI